MMRRFAGDWHRPTSSSRTSMTHWAPVSRTGNR